MFLMSVIGGLEWAIDRVTATRVLATLLEVQSTMPVPKAIVRNPVIH